MISASEAHTLAQQVPDTSFEYHWNRIDTLIRERSKQGYYLLNYAPCPSWSNEVQNKIFRKVQEKKIPRKVYPRWCTSNSVVTC